MNRQRIGRSDKPLGYHRQLLHAMRKFLPARGLALGSEDQRVRWTPRLLAITAVLMTWQPACALQDAFAAAREVVVSMYRSRRRPGESFGGFWSALRESSGEILATVVAALRKSTQAVAGPTWRMGRWAVMAVDGSRVECPRTASNEAAFGCAGRAKAGPQQYLTTVFHLATGLIWGWRRGPGTAAERDHLREMIAELPEKTLLLADAGFVGYDLMASLIRAGHDFVIRAGANVRLLRNLGFYAREQDGLVCLWPQAYRTQRPLVLRCLKVVDGRKAMCLLTSVLSTSELPDRQMIGLYRRRWVVEVAFRSLKQTMARRKMLSQTPAQARVELDWAVVGLWMLRLLSAQAGSARQRGRCSVAKTLRAVREAMRRNACRPRAGGLNRQLRKAVMDTYARRGLKRARDWPHKKKQKSPGLPKIRIATRSEVQMARKLIG